MTALADDDPFGAFVADEPQRGIYAWIALGGHNLAALRAELVADDLHGKSCASAGSVYGLAFDREAGSRKFLGMNYVEPERTA